MKKLLLVSLFSAFCICLFSQANSNLFYWIKFKDKSHNPYTVNNPSQFLSQKSIERRANQDIAIDSTDLPLTPAYIDSIAPFITNLVHRLKWFNIAVVEIDDTINATSITNSIKQFSFVDSIAPIAFFPYKLYLNKFETVHAVNQQIVYPNTYGASYHQISRLNADLLHQLGYRGQGIILSMMDNGFYNADTIAAFDSVRPRILATWDFVHNQQNVYTDGGHGTSTFSCIAANLPGHYLGTAPDANFFLLQSEDNDAEWVMEEYNWAAAAEMADSGGAQIFSTSLGYTVFNNGIGSHTYADLNGNKTIITQAGNIAFSKGILVITSAGNEGNSSWHYIAAPGDGDSILTIGAVDDIDTIASFSSRGPNSAGRIKPDVCSQGLNSAVIATDGTVTASSGTSFSCPIMAGCAASLWSAFPEKSAKEIKEAIIVSADRFWSPDNNYGYGIPNFYNAYLLLKTGYNGNILHINDDVAVYPNPFSNQLNVSLYSSEGKNHTIEIFDLSGRKVLSKQIYIRANTFEILNIYEVSSLAAGEYILRYDTQKKYSHRIIKAK